MKITKWDAVQIVLLFGAVLWVEMLLVGAKFI
jgi:hypothetical protein